MEPGDHLFRHESGRMVAALTRIFGVHNLGLAEDVVQDAFCRALEVWKIRGVPENPSAWHSGVGFGETLADRQEHRALGPSIARAQNCERNAPPESVGTLILIVIENRVRLSERIGQFMN